MTKYYVEHQRSTANGIDRMYTVYDENGQRVGGMTYKKPQGLTEAILKTNPLAAIRHGQEVGNLLILDPPTEEERQDMHRLARRAATWTL